MRDLINIVSKLYENEESTPHKENDGRSIVYRKVNGSIHREDGPAIIQSNGSKQWYIDDRRIELYYIWHLDFEKHKTIIIQELVNNIINNYIELGHKETYFLISRIFEKTHWYELKIIGKYNYFLNKQELDHWYGEDYMNAQFN